MPETDDGVAGKPFIRPIDPRDRRWPAVLELIDRCGGRSALEIDAAGWLPARHSVLAAFVGDTPAGHVAFHVRPAADRDGHPVYHGRRVVVEAKIDCLGVDDTYRNRGLEQHLIEAARKWAHDLHCRDLVDEPAGGALH